MSASLKPVVVVVYLFMAVTTAVPAACSARARATADVAAPESLFLLHKELIHKDPVILLALLDAVPSCEA